MKDKINEILTFVRPEFDFFDSDDFIDDGMLDSFDLVALVSALDEEYNISIDGSDIIPENFKSIESIEKLLKKYVG